MFKVVFFDLYGTLAGFKPSRYDIQSQACAYFGIEVTPEGIINGYAAADAYMTSQNAIDPVRLRNEKGKEQFFSEYEKLVLKGSGVDVTLDTARALWRRLRQIPYELSPFDDVIPVLRHLQATGINIGMISNMDRDGDELVSELGIAEHLDFIVTSAESNSEKPHPEIFWTALTKAKAKPEEAVHVGDQPISDVEGAIGAGIAAILLDRDGNHKQFERCPRIKDLLALPSLLENWQPIKSR